MLIHIPKERKIQLPHTYQNQKTVKIQDKIYQFTQVANNY